MMICNLFLSSFPVEWGREEDNLWFIECWFRSWKTKREKFGTWDSSWGVEAHQNADDDDDGNDWSDLIWWRRSIIPFVLYLHHLHAPHHFLMYLLSVSRTFILLHLLLSCMFGCVSVGLNLPTPNSRLDLTAWVFHRTRSPLSLSSQKTIRKKSCWEKMRLLRELRSSSSSSSRGVNIRIIIWGENNSWSNLF